MDRMLSDSDHGNNVHKEFDELYGESSLSSLMMSKMPSKVKLKSKKKSNTNTIVDEDKKRAKSAAAREKAIKLISVKRQKNIQPGECMKFIQVDMSKALEKFDFYEETLTMLDSSSVLYSINSSLPTNSLSWTRIIEEDAIDDDNKISTTIRKEKQKQLLIIWNWSEVIERIYDKSFIATLDSIVHSMPQLTLSLAIYGVEGYFDYHKQRKKKFDKMHEGIENVPKLSREDFENHLIDLQLNVHCSVRLVETSTDMSLLIYQYTKAIAEIPYKLETRNKLHEQMNFYAAGDNKHTIKVDSAGYGLNKLWLKQLCMFNTSSLAIAEAISSLYPGPEELINAYGKLTREDGEQLLKDIPIKRAIGPLTTVRKLGPELSRKIYILFTSTDGEELLN